MTVFVDASALISIIAGEADADRLADRLAAANGPVTSAVAVWETVAGLARSHGIGVADARAFVSSFLNDHHFQTCAITDATRELALDAYERFGKARHPAALNMGDCFAYACAKSLGATLLYKGDDFARTDLA